MAPILMLAPLTVFKYQHATGSKFIDTLERGSRRQRDPQSRHLSCRHGIDFRRDCAMAEYGFHLRAK